MYSDDEGTLFKITKKYHKRLSNDDIMESVMDKLEKMDEALQQITKQKEGQIKILREDNEYLNEGNIKLMKFIDKLKKECNHDYKIKSNGDCVYEECEKII